MLLFLMIVVVVMVMVTIRVFRCLWLRRWRELICGNDAASFRSCFTNNDNSYRAANDRFLPRQVLKES
jgi:hypothetical protein